MIGWVRWVRRFNRRVETAVQTGDGTPPFARAAPVLTGLSALGFVITLILHVSTYVSTAAGGLMPMAVGLFICMFPLFFPFVASAQARVRRLGRPLMPADILGWFPHWGRPLFVAVILYVGLNFALGFAHTRDGSPVKRDDAYVLEDHGQVTREVSAAEYRQGRAEQLRLFTGHPLVFYLAPALYFAALAGTPTAGGMGHDAARLGLE